VLAAIAIAGTPLVAGARVTVAEAAAAVTAAVAAAVT